MREYYVVINKQRTGPVKESELVNLYRNGVYPATTQVWTQGMRNWEPLSRVFPDISRQSAPAFTMPARMPDYMQAPQPEASCQNKKLLVTVAVSLLVSSVATLGVWLLHSKTGENAPAPASTVSSGAASATDVAPARRSFNSDDDIKKYLAERLEGIRRVDSSTAADYEKEMPKMLAALTGDSGPDGKWSQLDCQRLLVCSMVVFGELDAVVYLLEKRGFDPKFAQGEIYEIAARFGHLEVLKYLRQYQGDKRVNAAFREATMTGRLDVCKYFVDEFGAELPDRYLRYLLEIDESQYEEMAKFFSVTKGRIVTVEQLKADVASVAAYYREKGVEPDMSDSRTQEALKKCPNQKLKALYSL